MVAVAAWFEKQRGAKAVIPWFVLLFIAASAVASAFPAGIQVYQFWVSAAKAGLAVTLFLIGASLSRDNLRSVGWRPFAMGITLWLAVSVISLFAIRRVV
jgi:uncharacterized membrane protein YadS